MGKTLNWDVCGSLGVTEQRLQNIKGKRQVTSVKINNMFICVFMHYVDLK